MASFTAVIPSGQRYKTWADSVAALAKIGPTITFEVLPNSLNLISINTSETTFSLLEFKANGFFQKFQISVSPSRSRRSARPSLSFKVQAKYLLPVFRRNDQSIAECSLHLVEDPHHSCRLTITIRCHNGTIRKYKIVYEDTHDVYHAIMDKDSSEYCFAISSSILKEYIEHMAARAEELSVTFSDRQVEFLSYTQGASVGNEIFKQPIQTSINVDVAEFSRVPGADKDVNVVFGLRDFRILVNLADSMDSLVTSYFGDATPIMFEIGEEGICGKFMFVTTVLEQFQNGTAAQGRRDDTRMTSGARKLVSRQSTVRDIGTSKIARNVSVANANSEADDFDELNDEDMALFVQELDVEEIGPTQNASEVPKGLFD